MTHLDVEQIQRHLHGELAAAAAGTVRGHLAECPDCRARTTQAMQDEAELHALLRHLDHAPPQVTAAAIAAKARRPSRTWGRWAAGLLLAMSLGGVAYAQPAVRAAIVAVVGWLGARGDGPAPIAGPEQTPAPPLAGIAVTPGRTLNIRFTSSQVTGQLRVSLIDGTEVLVRAPAGAATFSAEVDRLVVDNLNATADFEITIPREASRVEITVGGVRLLLKEGPRVTAPVAPDTAGTYLLSLTTLGR